MSKRNIQIIDLPSAVANEPSRAESIESTLLPGAALGHRSMMLFVQTNAGAGEEGTLATTQSTIEAFESQIGRPIDGAMYSASFPGEPIFSSQVTDINTLGYIPQIQWNPTATLGSITSGSQDSSLLSAVERCQAIKGTIIIRLAHEFNLSGSSYGFNAESAASFISGWQYVVNFFNGANVNGGNPNGIKAPNVLWCWCVNVYNQGVTTGNVTDPTSWYPGDGYVDILGWDGYFYNNMATKVDYHDLVMPNYIQMTESIAPAKPFMITETGVQSGVSGWTQTGGGAYATRSSYFAGMYNTLRNMPKCIGLGYWNIAEASGPDYTIDASGSGGSDANALAAFVGGANAAPMVISPGQLGATGMLRSLANTWTSKQSFESSVSLPTNTGGFSDTSPAPLGTVTDGMMGVDITNSAVNFRSDSTWSAIKASVLEQDALDAQSWFAANMDPCDANNTQLTELTSGELLVARFMAPKSGSFSNVVLALTQAAVSPNSNQNFVGVYDSSGNLLQTSSDISASITSSSASNGFTITNSLSASVSTSPGQVFWAAILFNAGTMPLIGGTSGGVGSSYQNQNPISGGYPRRFGIAGTGLTTLPATISLTSLTFSNDRPFVAVY